MANVRAFCGEFRFLSNFYPAMVSLSGEVYPTVEHAYQAYKSNDPLKRAEIANALTPGKAKRMGQKVELRPDWEEVKDLVMEYFVTEKFKDPELREKLLATKDRPLVEGNNWGDTYWGICKGEGQNKLGNILMKLRKELQNA